MPCYFCGSEFAPYHFNGMMDDTPINGAFCEPCAPAEFKAQLGKLSRRNREKADAGVDRMHPTLRSRLDELALSQTRFPREALEFVYRAMAYAMSDNLRPQGCGNRHLSARELTEAAQDYATEAWGSDAVDHLQKWNLASSSDFGDLVYLLVGSGLLGAQEGDQRSEFDDLPFPL